MLSDDDLARLSNEERAKLIRRMLAASDGLPSIPEGAQRLRKRFLGVVIAACLLLIPWVALLALTLPRRYTASHWDATWAGFDLALFVSLAVTAWAAWRRRQVLVLAATVTGTLLVCDAWFDVITASTRTDLAFSLSAALFVELPLAALLFWAARLLLRRTARLLGWIATGSTAQLAFWRVPLVGVETGRQGVER
jgi:hypothetical protein